MLYSPCRDLDSIATTLNNLLKWFKKQETSLAAGFFYEKNRKYIKKENNAS